ncbi:MAG: SGNH/GDSL hydrolase family protein [Ruminococcaceae bacterium]|nr:SGNH/GDSL hydrolase family protein [Oscillospiraceae bacterium]
MSIIIVLMCVAVVYTAMLTACSPHNTAPSAATTGAGTTTVTPNSGTTVMTDSTTTATPDSGTTAIPDNGTTAVPDSTTVAPESTTTTEPNGGDPIPTPPETVELEVVWNQGRIKSNYGGKTPKLDREDTNYKYSDAIVIPKAGTEIKFTDDVITVSQEYDSVASRYDYVISSWSLVKNGMYLLDTRATNISGSNVAASPVCFPEYNESKTAIEKITYKYVSSKDNEMIRLCFKSNGNESDPQVYMTENASVGTKQEYLNFLEDSKKVSYDNNLAGKTIALFGDSYLDGNKLRGEYTWAQMIADKYGMTVYNHAIGGSTASNYNGGNYPLVDRWDNASGDPDIIVIECGRNDSNANFGIAIGSLDDTTTHTFSGALMYMIGNLREKYPDAMIVGVTSYHSPDRAATLRYAEAMRDLFAYYGYPCIFAADPAVSGVDTSTAEFRTLYMEHPGDHSHLNYRGHMLAMPKLEEALSKCYADFLAGKYTEKDIPKVNNPGSGLSAANN